MELGTTSLTVYFEDPFWVGVIERTEGGRYQVCKLTFGAEPRDCEVYDLLLGSWHRLRFSPAMDGAAVPDRRPNPKRMQRAAKRQLEARGTGTKAQQALKLQQEQTKTARKERSRLQKEEEQARRYGLRVEKRKQKHRGR